MQTKKITLVLVILMIVVLAFPVFAGGGGDSGRASAGGPVTLRYLTTLNLERPEGDVMKEIDAAFMSQYPNIKLEYIDTPMADTAAKIVAMATARDVPDIFTNNPVMIAQNADMGITADLTPILGRDYVSGFYEALLAEMTYQGKVYSAPFFTIPTGLLYRKDVFDANGLKPPATWEEMVETAAKLTKDGHYGVALMVSKGDSAVTRFYNILRSYNADELVEKNGQFETLVDSPGGIKAFNIYKELAKYAPPSMAQDAYAECIAHMANDRAYMMISGPHTIGAAIAQNPSMAGKLAGAPLPKGDRVVSTSGLYGFAISAQSKYPTEAAQYIKFIMDSQNAMKFMNVTGRIPTRKETGGSDTVANNPTYRGFVDAIPYIIVVPQASFYAKLADPTGTTYQAIILQNTPTEQAVRNLGNQLKTIIQESE
jgi:ABC-type glycerol-3-phosphate transport system substrate-binding protein